MSNQLGTIAILGSGETSPNLVAVHRKLLQEIPKPIKASLKIKPAKTLPKHKTNKGINIVIPAS